MRPQWRVLGIRPTNNPLEIHGVTFVVDRGGEPPQLYRYVDWMGVATQIGLEVSLRVPLDEEQYRNLNTVLNEERGNGCPTQRNRRSPDAPISPGVPV